MLPDDIIYVILGFIEDITDIHDCYFVCKQWKTIIDKITTISGSYTFILNQTSCDILFKTIQPYLFNISDIKYIGRNTDVSNYAQIDDHIKSHIKSHITLNDTCILDFFLRKKIQVKIIIKKQLGITNLDRAFKIWLKKNEDAMKLSFQQIMKKP